MGLVVVTPPTDEPVALALAKKHARIPADLEDDDEYVGMLVADARELAEVRCNRAFARQTFELTLDGFPPSGCDQAVETPRPPLVSVESIAYLDPSGEEQTLDPEAYRVVAGTPGVLAPTGSTWPKTLPGPGTVKVRYVAGFDGDLPTPARRAILMLVAGWYNRRESVVVGSAVAALPFGVEDLLASVDWRVSG